MEKQVKSPQEILKELMPFALPQYFGGQLAKKGAEGAGDLVKKAAGAQTEKPKSELEILMESNPLVKKGINTLADIQDEQLRSGAANKDVSGLLQDLVQTHSPDARATAGWSPMQKLLVSGGVGMAAMGGNDAVVSGILGLLKEKSKQEKPWGLNTSIATPQGMETYGYDSQGNPMFRKVQLDPREKEILRAEGKALGAQLVFAQAQKTNMRAVEGKLSILIDAKHRMDKSTKDLTGGVLGSGRIGGAASAGLGKLGLNPAYADFTGALEETATALAKIAAPSARIGPELMERFQRTIPKVWANDAETINQVATSMTNAFAQYIASDPEFYRGRELGEVVGEFRNNIQYTLNSILEGGFEGAKYDKPFFTRIGVHQETGRRVGRKLDGTLVFIDEE